METKYIQVYGIQRAATTFTTTTIMDNFENVFVSADGKHMHPATYEFIETGLRDRLTKDWMKKNKKLEAATIKKIKDVFELRKPMHPVIVIKNPYSWYLSIERWEKMNEKPFDDTIAAKWYTRFNENYRIWKELLEAEPLPFGKGTISRYEDLLESPKIFINKLANEFNLKPKKKIKLIEYMASSKKADKFTEEKRQFYLQKGDFGIPRNKINMITEMVDWNLMKFYGYEPKR